MKKLSIILVAITIFSSCDPADNRLKVINNSNENIHVYFSCDSAMNELQIFRTGYYKNSCNEDSSYIESDQYILKNSILNFPKRLGNRAWIDYIESCNNKTLYFFFLSDSILDNFSDIEIKTQNMYIKMEKYSLNELNELDWTIVFQK